MAKATAILRRLLPDVDVEELVSQEPIGSGAIGEWEASAGPEPVPESAIEPADAGFDKVKVKQEIMDDFALNNIKVEFLSPPALLPELELLSTLTSPLLLLLLNSYELDALDSERDVKKQKTFDEYTNLFEEVCEFV